MDKYGYIGIETLLAFCENSKDHAVTPNDFMRMPRVNLFTIEPEQIVRCKDCKHGSPNGRYGCRVYHYKRYETHDMKPDDFCSRAERRTDEHS